MAYGNAALVSPGANGGKREIAHIAHCLASGERDAIETMECPFKKSSGAAQPTDAPPSGIDKRWANEERLRSVVDNVIDGIVTIDERGIVLSFNRAAEKLFGYAADEVLGRNVNMLMPEPFRSQHDNYVRHYVETGERRIIGIGREVVGQRRDGTTFPMDLAVSEFHVEGVRYFTGIVRDITERKVLEEELRQRARELALSDRRKDEFLAMLAHELRNPLAPIMNALQILRMRKSDDSMVEEMRKIMERQTRQMGRLVDDLLDISRITRGKIQLKPERLDLLSVVQIAIETTRPHIEARRHKLTVCLPSRPVWLQGDAARLEQVLANLLNNAAKYTEPGKQIWLSVAVNDGQVALHVKDNGIGIEPEMLPQIFDLFAQADKSLDRSQGGLGIGLTLVHRLVEMHGGTVEARSEGLGKGSEFIVRLPTLPEPAGGARGETARVIETVGRNLNILVVDDNVDEAQSLSLVLKMYGHQVKTAYNGPAALDAARMYQPDVVLLDIGLPEMDGYEVARRLPEAVQERPLLIAVTGYGQEENRRRAIEAGFDQYLIKPVDLDRLHQLLMRSAA